MRALILGCSITELSFALPRNKAWKLAASIWLAHLPIASPAFAQSETMPSVFRPPQFSVQWFCPQTHLPGQSPDLPVMAQVNFPTQWDGNSPRIDFSEWRRFIEPANRSSRDYYRCMYNTMNRLMVALRNTAFLPDDATYIIPDSVGEMRRINAAIGQGALERNAIPVMAPLELDPQPSSVTPRFRPGDYRRGPEAACSYFFLAPLDHNNYDLPEAILLGRLDRGPFPAVFRRMSAECRQRIAGLILDTIAQLQPSEARCPISSNDPLCLLFRRRTLQAVAQLRNLLASIRVPRAPLAGFESCFRQNTHPAELLHRLAVSLGFSLGECVHLRHGESTVVNRSDAGAGRPAAYVLSREMDGSFTATLNPFFHTAAGVSEAVFREHVQHCIDEINPHYAPGHDGFPGLKLRLANDNGFSPQTNLMVPPIHIQVENRVLRENSATLALNTPCPVIMHELTHNLGAADHYQERWEGYRVEGSPSRVSYSERAATLPRNDCRALGPANDLMTNSNLAYDSIFGRQETGVCQCEFSITTGLFSARRACDSAARYLAEDSHGPDLESRLAALRNALPSVGVSCSISRSPLPPENRRPSATSVSTPNSFTFTASITSQPIRRSLLFDREAQAIIAPGCIGENPTYYLCSREAFGQLPDVPHTSRRNLGPGCTQGFPAECLNESWVTGPLEVHR